MLEVAVTKRLGSFEIEAEFSCASDGIVALFGRSGAGKTSLINMLAGLSRPDSGRIEIAGVPLFDSRRGLDLPPERRRMGYVFQEGRLFPHMSVHGNLNYGLRRAPPGERRIRLDQIVELLGLEALLERRPHDLSGGEKQRVALGRALLANPRLLLLDEPLAALDQARKDEVLPFIERLRDELTIPIVYVSHAMPEIVRLADVMVLMSEGRVKAVGPLDEVTSRLDLRPCIDQFMPVDVYVPGCPPRPETLLEGVMAIQRIVEKDSVKSSGERGRGLGLVVEPTVQIQVEKES